MDEGHRAHRRWSRRPPGRGRRTGGTRSAAVAAFLGACLAAALAPGAAGAQGFERNDRVRFSECDQPRLRGYLDRLEAVEGVFTVRPSTCSATRCDVQLVSRLAPSRLLDVLSRLPAETGTRARIGVEGGAYELVCLPGRAAAEGPARYVDACGETFEGAGDVLFDYDRAAIRPDARPFLDEVVDRILALGPRAVVVAGHTDARGTEAYNQDLSERRALVVVDELRRAAASVGARIEAAAYGERAPRAPNTDAQGRDYPAGRALNRRVEIALRTDAPGCHAAAEAPTPERAPLDPADW